MNIKEAPDIYQKRSHFRGRNAAEQTLPRGRTQYGGEHVGRFTHCYNTIGCSDFEHPFSIHNQMSARRGRKWNYAQKVGEHAQNSRRNPLIFHEIPRNYRAGRFIYFVRHGKSNHLTSKKRLKAAAIRGIRTSQVVDFWRNLAYSHIKIEGGRIYDGAIYDLRAQGPGWGRWAVPLAFSLTDEGLAGLTGWEG